MPRESEFLLIDVSNSYTKLALASRDKLGRVRRVPTSHLGVKTLHALRFEKIVLCSVVPEKTRLLRAFFKKQPIVEVSHRIRLGVGIDYPKPQSIGADRLANAASAAALYGAPVVVVDFGTAVTFDIISRGKKYLGGVIAPGLEVMTDYLYQRTALLPHINLSEPVTAIGKSTRGAMMAGAVYGYRGLVRQIISQIRTELGVRGKLPVVATGGYAELIASHLPEVSAVHPNLTLEGLRIIGVLN
jgi:type III pantothenate kinase